MIVDTNAGEKLVKMVAVKVHAMRMGRVLEGRRDIGCSGSTGDCCRVNC